MAGGGREELAELATQRESVDLIIPRGGEGLKEALQAVATVPVIYAASGNCHVYVDASADLDRAEAIVLNAKTQRPGVCNAAETLLVHEAVAERFLPRILRSLEAAGVLVRGDERTRAIAAAAPEPAGAVEPAGEEDWASEYLALTLAVGVVDSTAEAIEHIGRYGSGHSEAIVTATRRPRGRSSSGGRGVRVRERLDALHRRGRVRDGRGDRQLDAEAARARADRPARAVHVQVPRRGRRARPRLTQPVGTHRHPRRHVQPAAPRTPRARAPRAAASSDSRGC